MVSQGSELLEAKQACREMPSVTRMVALSSHVQEQQDLRFYYLFFIFLGYGQSTQAGLT